MYLSVIIPAYNEEKRIGSTIDAVCGYLSQKPYAWEVIVVDNRSHDATVRMVTERMQSCAQVRLTREPKGGKGYAVMHGMLEAAGDVRLMMDADSSTSIDHLDRMLPYLSQGYDVVIGSLAVKGAKILRGGTEPFWRVILGKLGNKWIQLFAVWGVNDTQRGFKIFSRRAAEEIFPRITIGGWGFDVEALAIARVHGYTIKEVPVVWNNPPETRVTLWTYPKVLLETLSVFWRRVCGVYKRRLRPIA